MPYCRERVVKDLDLPSIHVTVVISIIPIWPSFDLCSIPQQLEKKIHEN